MKMNKMDEQVVNLFGEWVVENEMKINPGKSKAESFTKARVKERIRYSGDQLIPEASSFKYLIVVCSDLIWADHLNYTLRKARKALHFITRIRKKREIIIRNV